MRLTEKELEVMDDMCAIANREWYRDGDHHPAWAANGYAQAFGTLRQKIWDELWFMPPEKVAEAEWSG